MSLCVAPYPKFKAWDHAGNPLDGGYLYTVQPGTAVAFGISPAYPQPTYTDATGATANPNPIILDSNGEYDVWLSGYTKMVLYKSDGTLILSEDNVSAQSMIQASTLQWILQTTQATYYNSTTFLVTGNVASNFPAGTRVQAQLSGTFIYGTVVSATASGSPVVTTVVVLWDSTTLNLTLSAVYTGIIPAPATAAPSSLPIRPPNLQTGTTYAVQFSDGGTLVSANNAATVTFTLPAATAVPAGWWVDFRNTGVGLLVISGISGVEFIQWAGGRVYSDGTTWCLCNYNPRAVLTKTGDYVILPSDGFRTILANKGSAIQFTLPLAAAVMADWWVKIKNIGAGVLTVVETIDGAASPTMNQYTEMTVFSDGTSWWGKIL